MPLRAGVGATSTTGSGPAGGPAPVYSETKNPELGGQQQYAQQPPLQQPVQYVEHSGQAAPQAQQEYYAPQPNQQVSSA